jgi:hypothetical protein
LTAVALIDTVVALASEDTSKVDFGIGVAVVRKVVIPIAEVTDLGVSLTAGNSTCVRRDLAAVSLVGAAA